jgi:hypothetical protein
VDSTNRAGVLAQMPRGRGLHEVFGFDSPSAGPLLVAVVSARGWSGGDSVGVNGGVFDASGGVCPGTRTPRGRSGYGSRRVNRTRPTAATTSRSSLCVRIPLAESRNNAAA